MLRPLLFNIFINDLFPFIESGDIRDSVDDCNLFKRCDNIDKAKSSIKMNAAWLPFGSKLII